jgi:hypothetical protein
VRQPPGHLTPRSTALGGDESRHIIENDDIATVRFIRELRPPQEQDLWRSIGMLKFDLLLPFRALALGKGIDDGLAQHLLAWPDGCSLSAQTGKVVNEDGQCALIHRPQHEAPVEDEDAGRQIGQNRFQVGTCSFKLGAVAFVIASRLIQLAGHLLE